MQSYLQPLFSLLFALQAQHNGLTTLGDDLQLVLFPLRLLFFVDDGAAHQTDVQQWGLVF